VDKGVNNRHLTAENAFNDGLFNKMPNPQAYFLCRKINDLRNVKSRRMAFFRHLEKIIFVHKWEAGHRCCAALGIL
jgi:hypothetical protein